MGEIDFAALPNSFALKTNHDCGGVVLVPDKAAFLSDKTAFESAMTKLTNHLNTNYYIATKEWHYGDITPRVFAEELLGAREQKTLENHHFQAFFCKLYEFPKIHKKISQKAQIYDEIFLKNSRIFYNFFEFLQIFPKIHQISPQIHQPLNFFCQNSYEILTKGQKMATYAMGDLKKGLKIELDGVPFKIVEYQHVKPGKGPAFVRIKIKSFLDGKVLEKTIHAGDKCEAPNLEDKQMQYLYDDGENCQFMDTATYEQVAISDEDVGDAKKWMLDGMMVDVMFHNGKAIGVEVPQVVELKIVETAPNFKGDTQGSNKKPATLETGAVVQIPFHILEGEVIRVDTTRGEYIEKAGK